jgi:hypothetical protein
LVSGYAAHALLARAANTPGARILAKPFGADQLIANLEQLAAGRGAGCRRRHGWAGLLPVRQRRLLSATATCPEKERADLLANAADATASSSRTTTLTPHRLRTSVSRRDLAWRGGSARRKLFSRRDRRCARKKFICHAPLEAHGAPTRHGSRRMPRHRCPPKVLRRVRRGAGRCGRSDRQQPAPLPRCKCDT